MDYARKLEIIEHIEADVWLRLESIDFANHDGPPPTKRDLETTSVERDLETIERCGRLRIALKRRSWLTAYRDD